MGWKKTGLLSVAFALGSMGGFGSIHTTDTVAAATVKESAKVYNQFQQYVQKWHLLLTHGII